MNAVKRFRTFLILDDEEDNRILVRHALERAFSGARVFEAADLIGAIEAARDVTLDGVITDHHLGTLDGPTLMKRLRDVGVECPVVMVTSSSDPKVFRRAYEACAAHVFSGGDIDFVGYFRSLLQK